MDKNIAIIMINILTVLFVPFLVLGIINKTKAFWGGRKGASVFQPFYNTIKLFKKDKTISTTTSWIFNFAPVVVFATTLFAAFFAPMVNGYSIINIAGAFVIFSYILGLGKFFALISAMDTGSSFEGMGASREACFTTIVEPAFFIILASTVVLSGNYNFNSITNTISNFQSYGILIAVLASISLLVMLLIECSRIPVDDPSTHLELTMIHEVMILDNSGFDLALLSWASGIKMVILMSLIANFIIPSGLNNSLNILLYYLIIFVLAVLTGTIESAIARLRMSHVFEFIFVMSSLALVIASLTAVKIYGV